MGPENYIYGVITGGSGAAMIAMIINWARFYKKDRAVVRKAESEAFETETHAMSEGWRDLVTALNKIRYTEQTAFERIVAEERKRIQVLEDKVANYQIQMDEVIAQEEECQNNMRQLRAELSQLKGMRPDK